MTSRAWALPILSSLLEGVPGRQASLLTATGAGRSAFAQSMDHLIEIGLVERNPGHGHPLRPEFRLTEPGKQAAAIADRIRKAAGAADQDLLRRSWTLPVLVSLYRPAHFIDIKRRLLTVTDRALSQCLKSMEDQNWVERRISAAARPPRSLYRAVNTGAAISRATHADICFGPGP